MSNNLDKQYQDLLQDILDNGTRKGDRTGTGTISVFGRQIRHNMKDGFPLITTKKMPFKTILTELIWFLKGDTNIKFLVDNGCNIWNGDAYKNYFNNVQEYEKLPNENDVKSMTMVMDTQGNIHPSSVRFTMEEFIERIKTNDEFAKKWGDLGPVYGKQWRRWKQREFPFGGGVDNKETIYVDQIANLVKDLRENPDSRRLMVNAWNVAEIDQMVLPPCHYGFQLYTRELTSDEWIALMIEKHGMILEGGDESLPKRAISLIWNQRSVDTFLGLPFNIASYGLLLEILAKEVNMVPDELIGNLGDTHLYSNHIEQAKELIGHKLSNDEILEYYYTNIKPDKKWKRDEYGEYFYYSEENSMWVQHSTSDIIFGMAPMCPIKTREPLPLPSVKINDSWKFGSSSPVFADKLKLDMFKLVDYKSHETIKAPLSN